MGRERGIVTRLGQRPRKDAQTGYSNDGTRAQVRDLLCVIAELGEDRVRVLAERGRPSPFDRRGRAHPQRHGRDGRGSRQARIVGGIPASTMRSRRRKTLVWRGDRGKRECCAEKSRRRGCESEGATGPAFLCELT